MGGGQASTYRTLKVNPQRGFNGKWVALPRLTQRSVILKPYFVYSIYATNFTPHGKNVYKYGISSIMDGSRPKKQISLCAAHYRTACTWRKIDSAPNLFVARGKEASYIYTWCYRRGSCPPGHGGKYLR